MLDYHLHLWPHGQRDTAPTVEQVAEYCEIAQQAGVSQIALTEHLFRFVQADQLLRGFWDDEPDAALRASMVTYWDDHARADLDAYVDCVLEAKSQGLPVVLGLEVDYYRGRMHDVQRLLAGYPFDVLLGSVHWIGVWRFDDLSDDVSMNEWSARDVDRAWEDYALAIEELAASGTCDVLAHPDLIKVAGFRSTCTRGVLRPVGRGCRELRHGGRMLVSRTEKAGRRDLSGTPFVGAVRSCRRPIYDCL